MSKLKRTIKRLLYLVLILIGIWSVFNISLIVYGFGQLRGQLNIVMNSRPINEVLNDNNVPDSVKSKLHLIEEIKKFAIDSLGLKESKNYTTFFDQHNKPLLWVLTASQPYRIAAYHWKFPLLGSVSYKGFFDYDKGKKEEYSMITRGYDTDYDDVSAWSTLGWFKDPILSNMIRRGTGQLAELIIHEMTHSTIYLKSNVDLNENLASVCGEQGAIRFLESRYGKDSEELKKYIQKKEDYDKFSDHMLRGTSLLDTMYDVMKDSLTIRKKTAKDRLIREIVKSMDTVSFSPGSGYKSIFRKSLPNNAYFLNFVRYDAQKLEMKNELTTKFSGNIKKYIDSLREK